MTKGGKNVERLMTPRQVSEATGMSYKNACRLMRSGEIESLAIGVDPDSPRARLMTTERAVNRWQVERQERAQKAAGRQKKAEKAPRRRYGNEEPPPGGVFGPDGTIHFKRR